MNLKKMLFSILISSIVVANANTINNDTIIIQQKLNKAIESKNKIVAIQLFEEAEKLAKKQSNLNWKIEPKIAKSNYFFINNKFSDALMQYNEVIVYCEKNNLLEKKAKTYIQISTLYAKINEHSKSYDFALKSLKICKKLNLETGIAKALKHMADELYGDYNDDKENLKNLKTALGYYNQAIEIFKKKEDYFNWISTLNNCSLLYMYAYKPEESLKMLNLANEIYINHKNKIVITPLNNVKADILCNKGWVYMAGMNDYPKAVKSITEAINYCYKNYQNAFILSRNFMNLTFAFKRLKQYDLAEKSCQKAIFYSKKSQDIYSQAESYLNLSEFDSIRGDYKNSITNYKFYSKLKDSINSTKKIMLLEKANIQYETEKVAQENKDLQEKNTARIKTITILGFLVLAILTVFYFYFKSKKTQSYLLIEKSKNLENEKKLIQLDKILEEEKNKVLVAENEIQNRELTAKDISLEQNKNTLQSAYEDLRHLNKNLTKEDTELVSKLKSNIKSNLSFTNEWQSTALHFEKVHPDFFKDLYKLNPNLTQNDLRQCAYIKLNLNTKEIAWILNIDANSVRINRYRIKKKLRLEENIDLIGYISSI